jgi:hypothetical protein
LWKREDKSSVCCGWKLIRNIVLIAEREAESCKAIQKKSSCLANSFHHIQKLFSGNKS